MILAGIDDASDEAIFRIHDNPLVVWVWAGAVVALLGGLARAADPAASGPRRRAGRGPDVEPAPAQVSLTND